MTLFATAIEVLQCRGWTQGALVDETGAMCAIGALYTACHGNWRPCSVDRHDHFAQGWFEQLPLVQSIAPTHTTLEEWNDAPERTVEDVLLLLKYADAGELTSWQQRYARSQATTGGRAHAHP
jgi:hypothetical protein